MTTGAKKEVEDGTVERVLGTLFRFTVIVVLIFGAYRADRSGRLADETHNVTLQIAKKIDESADGALVLEAEWEDFEQVVRRVRVVSKPDEMPIDTQARYDDEFEKKFKAYPKSK